MAEESVIVDTGFVVAFLRARDGHHDWAVSQALELPPPWITCEAAFSEMEHLLDNRGIQALKLLCRRGALATSFELAPAIESVLDLMDKYADVPMSVADACLVRMTELVPNPVVLTTDRDFRVYRRSGRRVIPCRLPEETRG